MKIYKLFLTILCVSYFHSNAQQIMVIIQGATIHVGNGKVIPKGYLGFGGGKIMLCDSVMSATYKNATIIDGRKKDIYPGLICMNSTVGLNEIDQARPTHDFQEVGSVNPNVRSLIAYNTDSKVIPTLRSNGICYVQVVPQGGLVSGTSSVMKTSGWNWEDASYNIDDGVHMNWPEFIPVAQNVDRKEMPESKNPMNEEFQTIDNLFEQSFQYCKTEKPEVINVRFEAMRGIFNGTKNLYVHVDGTKGIISSINFMKKYPGVKMILVGAANAYKLTELISENHIPVVLTNIHRLPQKSNDDIDQPYKTAAELMKAGITVAIGHSGSWQTRSLMFEAGTCAGYGLTKEEALETITQNPAKILGIDKTCGTLETGKDATIIISSGDLLDMKSSIVEQLFIGGEEIDLNNLQKDLYKKYSEKYKIK